MTRPEGHNSFTTELNDKGNPTRSHDETRRRLFTWQATARLLSTCRCSCMEMCRRLFTWQAAAADVEQVPLLVQGDA
eukprot:scaffold65851_cov53-Phaeocystis_antarctica.AAC.1